MMRLAWWLSIVASVAAYLAVIVPAHRAVAALESQARALYDSANRDERLVAHAAQIAKAEHRVESEIAQLAGGGGTDTLLDTLDRESRRMHVRVIAVTPGAGTPENEKHDLLEATGVGIELEGSFSDLLALLEDMSDGSALVSVDSIALTLTRPATHGAPALHATLGARLYTLAADSQKGAFHENPGAVR